ALVMRGVVRASHNVQIFTTVGLSTALQNVALVLWTGDFRFVRPWESSVVIRIPGAAFNLSQIIAFAVALGFTLALFAFMKSTHAGRVMRATAQDGEAATLMGINVDRVYRLAFAIGIACVGVAGVLVSPLYSVYPTAGLQFVLLAYVVVVLGGLGDMVGALLGAIIVAGGGGVGACFFRSPREGRVYFLSLFPPPPRPPPRFLRPAGRRRPRRLTPPCRASRSPSSSSAGRLSPRSS